MPAPIKNGTTTVELIAAVPFNGTTEQILFKNKGEQDRYFTGRVLRIVNVNGTYSSVGFSGGSYQRYNYVIRLNVNKESVYDSANYLRFRNNNSHKWVYAYISDMHWNNSSECDIFFYIDSWQTYMFDIWWKPSFVENETTNTDEFGEHQENENISFDNYDEIGKQLVFEDSSTSTLNSTFVSKTNYTVEQVKNFNDMTMGYIVEIQNDFDIEQKFLEDIVHTSVTQNGITSANIYIFFPNPKIIGNFIANLFSKGLKPEDYNKLISIYAVPLYPMCCVGNSTIVTVDGKRRIAWINGVLDVAFLKMGIFSTELTDFFQIVNISDIEGRTSSNITKNIKVTGDIDLNTAVKNKKTLYSPFVNINIESQSDNVLLKPQAMNYNDGNLKLSFNFVCNIFHSAYTLFLDSSYYNRVSYSLGNNNKECMYKVTLPLFPTMNAYVDATAQWWRQNSFRTIANLTLAAASIGVGVGAIGSETVLGGALAGGSALSLPSTAKGGTRSNNDRNDYQVMGGIAAGVNEIGKIYSATMAPDYEIGQIQGTDLYGSQINPVKLTVSLLIPDERRQCDDYFSMFGYSIKQIKMPDFVTSATSRAALATQYGDGAFNTKRQYWYYLKTKICNISSFTTCSYPGGYDNANALLSNNQNLVPQEHIEIIKNMFNNGIRLWLFKDFGSFDRNVLNYTLDNKIV